MIASKLARCQTGLFRIIISGKLLGNQNVKYLPTWGLRLYASPLHVPLRPRPHVSGFFWKRNFFFTDWPSEVPSTRKRWNGHRKRNFSKTVSKVELLKNAVFLFSCGRGSFWKRIKKVAFSNENGYVWTRPEKFVWSPKSKITLIFSKSFHETFPETDLQNV